MQKYFLHWDPERVQNNKVKVVTVSFKRSYWIELKFYLLKIVLTSIVFLLVT
jgi:hypothetical protein